MRNQTWLPPPPAARQRPKSVFHERVTPRRLPTTPNVYSDPPPERYQDLPDVEAYRLALLRRGWVDRGEAGWRAEGERRGGTLPLRSKSTPLDEGAVTLKTHKATFI